MKKIDINNWKRKETYRNFINYTNPTFSMGTRLDVTELVGYCKKEEKSFFATFLYMVSVCINDIEELRTRICGEDVVVFDKVDPSYIVMIKDEELVTCTSEAKGDYGEFYIGVRAEIDSAKERGIAVFNSKVKLDCVFISCVPWTDFTSVTNPFNLSDKSTTSIPRITWGKYVENMAGRLEMAIDVAAHHALADGRHISKFYEKIQWGLLNPEKFMKGIHEG